MDNVNIATSSDFVMQGVGLSHEETPPARPWLAACHHQHESGRTMYRVRWSSQLVCEACLHAAAAACRVPAPTNDNDVPCVSVGAGDRKPSLDDYDRSTRWLGRARRGYFPSYFDADPDGLGPRRRRGGCR